MDEQLLLDIATKIGALLLQNGAETYRVEDSVGYVLNAYDLEEFTALAFPGCIIVSITTRQQVAMNKSVRVSAPKLNIHRIMQLNSLCRYISTEHPDLIFVVDQLNEILEIPTYPNHWNQIANVMAATSFSFFFGGSLTEASIAGVIGALIHITSGEMKRFRMNSFSTTIINSFLIAVIALFFSRLRSDISYTPIIIGCFMLLVPGVAITNSARDFIAGDYLSGTIRLSEALLVATSIALGSGIALSLFR